MSICVACHLVLKHSWLVFLSAAARYVDKREHEHQVCLAINVDHCANLRKKHNSDVNQYLLSKFEGCAHIMDYYHDFVSLVEMEICSKAGSFVRLVFDCIITSPFGQTNIFAKLYYNKFTVYIYKNIFILKNWNV